MEKWHPAWECVRLQNIPFLEIIFFSYLCYSELWNTPQGHKNMYEESEKLLLCSLSASPKSDHKSSAYQTCKSCTEPWTIGKRGKEPPEFINSQPNDNCCLGLLKAFLLTVRCEFLLLTTRHSSTSVPKPVRKLMEAIPCNFSPKPSNKCILEAIFAFETMAHYSFVTGESSVLS